LKDKRIFLYGLIAAVLLAGAVAANAEVYIKQNRHTDAYSVMGQSQLEKNEITITWLAKDKARTDMGEESSIIVLPEKKIMLMINHENMTYTELPLDSQDMMGAMMGGEQSEEAKKAMEMAKKMAGAFMQSIEAKVTETGETKKIKDWNCRKYIIEVSMAMGKVKSEAWATEDVKIDPRLYFMAANAMMATQQGFENLIKEMQKIKGMIVYQESTSEVMGSEIKMVEEVVEISEKAAPAGAYDVPAGYKKAKGMGR
jgi:hypothetical protein